VRHSTGLSGGWAWALGAACSIAGCLNPMPDDFPSHGEHADHSVEPGAPSGNGTVGTTPMEPSAPNVSLEDGADSDDPSPTDINPGTGNDGPAATDAADAGAPVTSDGGAAADDGEL
jgi:hypothetical protein